MHQRYELEEEAFIVHSGHIGKIKNISKGGLLCRCIGNSTNAPQNCLLDILSVGDDYAFKMKKVPARIINEYFAPASGCQSTVIRRCGVQFDGLTSDQRLKLDTFITDHALAKT